jgi:hypothetical protein
MHHPAAVFFRRAAELHRIQRIYALHHHALEEITIEHVIGGAEPLVPRQRIGAVNPRASKA